MSRASASSALRGSSGTPIPGVVSHATNVLEHPELVADRIERQTLLKVMLVHDHSWFGVLIAGCTVVNVNPLYTARELEHQLKDSGAEDVACLLGLGLEVARRGR